MTTAMTTERICDAAYARASRSLTALLYWAVTNPYEAAELVDQTIATLGVPSPVRGADGENVSGSVLRQLLHHAQAEWHARRMTAEDVA